MTKRQRRVLEVLGVLIAFASLAAGLAALGGDDEVSVRADPSTGASSTTTTTMALAPVTASTAPVDTNAPAASTTTAVPSTTAAPGTVVDGSGAVLTRPDFAPPRPLVGDCRSLADEGWSVVDCGRVAAGGTELVWLVAERGRERRGTVFRPSTAGTWVAILDSLGHGDAAQWAGIRVKVADVTSGGGPEVAFGFRRQAGDVLEIDLVQAPGRVVVHEELAAGAAVIQSLGIETWAADSEGGRFVRAVIRFDAGAWRRVVEDEGVPASSVPPSDL